MPPCVSENLKEVFCKKTSQTGLRVIERNQFLESDMIPGYTMPPVQNLKKGQFFKMEPVRDPSVHNY